MPKPRGDLGDLAVPKQTATLAVPHEAPGFASQVAANTDRPISSTGPRALTVKLDGPLYARLRDYCHARERGTTRRVTHQQVMVDALLAYLDVAEGRA